MSVLSRQKFIVVVPDDCVSMQQAFLLAQEQWLRTGCPAVIRIASGHVVEKGLVLRGGDHGWLQVTAEDACVQARVSGDLFACCRATGPQISCLFDMGGRGGNGIRLQDGSSLCVDKGCGVVNAGNIGLRMYSCCSAVARGARFSGAAKHGIWMEQSSSGDFDGADVSQAGATALHVNHASRATARNLVAEGAGQEGVYSRHASTITLWKARIGPSGTFDLRVEAGALIDAWGASYSTTSVNAVINSCGTSGQILDRRRPAREISGVWEPRLFTSRQESVSALRVSGRWQRFGFNVSLCCEVVLKAKTALQDFPLFITGLPFRPVRDVLVPAVIIQAGIADVRESSGSCLKACAYLAEHGHAVVKLLERDEEPLLKRAFERDDIALTLGFTAQYESVAVESDLMLFPEAEESG